MKKIWHAIIDAWLAMKRFFWTFADSGIWFETKPGALFIEVHHLDERKTIRRLATEKLGTAIRYIDKQPYGSAVVFREGDNWVLVPNFLVRKLRDYLVVANDALSRSKNASDISGVVETPTVNSRSAPKSVN